MIFSLVRPVDAGLIAGLAAVAFAVFDRSVAWRSFVGALLWLLTASVAWASSGPATWLRDLHLRASQADGTAVNHVRKAGRNVPCPYVDSWYAVALSAEVPPGKVVSVTVCNRNLVVWRPNTGGEAVVADAYCPHLGAHLGLGGATVESDCLRCPFHGWRFDCHGSVVETPGAASCPAPSAGSSLRKWRSQELNGVVSIWMSSASHKTGAGNYSSLVTGLSDADAVKQLAAQAAADKAAVAAKSGRPSVPLQYDDGPSISSSSGSTSSRSDGASGSLSSAAGVARAIEGAAEPGGAAAVAAAKGTASSSVTASAAAATDGPWFAIPPVAELNGPAAWHYGGFTENIINAHQLEIPENGSDVAHLPALHDKFVVPWLRWLLSHRWEATWTPRTAPGERHLVDITISEEIMLLKRIPLPGKVRVAITQAGPSQVYLQMAVPGVGRITIVETVTPVSPLQQRVLHAVYIPPYVPLFIAKIILAATLVQFEADQPIWHNKRFEPRPVLSTADKGIAAFRRWTAQFWHAGSITFEEAQRQHIADKLGLPTGAAAVW